jgi:predicted aspartyl protease
MRVGIVLTCLAICFAPIDAGAASRCALKQIAWLDFALTSDGRPTIPIKLAGREARLIVDTGSSFSLIDQAFVSALNLPQRNRSAPAGFSIGAAGGEAASARVGKVQVGVVELPKAYDFFVHPNAKAEWGSNVSGTIGLNILQDIEIEIDMAHRKVGFYSQEHCRGKVVYWAPEWIEFPLKARRVDRSTSVILDGKPLRATLDTGSPSSILDLDVATQMYGLTPGSAKLSADGELISADGRKLPSYRTQFDKLQMGGFEVHGLKVRVADLTGTDIILGMQHLQYLHLYFAFGEDKVYATAANATFPDPGRQATRDPKPLHK